MPKRSDLHSILVIGAGPIIIGQACEFDYSGTQACLALREEGYRVILVNSNPATIMTDPKVADATYIEPLTVEFLEKIIAKERPCAILPTMGGQTALNLSIALQQKGILTSYNVELIGADHQAICRAEDREKFRQIVSECGLNSPQSTIVGSLDEAKVVAREMGFPLIIRPSFTLGGAGCGTAHNLEEFSLLCKKAFANAPHQKLLIDEALIGWKEFELEVIRDRKDNCIVICSIENFDPLGIHTGDSITVAPALTLTDKEFQKMRNAAFAILRAVGVETGGANVQFAIHPKDGRMIVIEMNPRVSRSSALASKATGFPIAKVAAKLAIGYTLDELQSGITGGKMPASFEPVIDYVVVKIPYFHFEKFPAVKDLLGPQMQSVGEAMAIGRTFQEALQKAMRSVETAFSTQTDISKPNSKRLWQLFAAFEQGLTVSRAHTLTQIDPWFLEEIKAIVEMKKSAELTAEGLLTLKRIGCSDGEIALRFNKTEEEIKSLRDNWKIKPVFNRIDSCSGEFSTEMAYLYATYENSCESAPSTKPKIAILGSGPNRIGQGIEFDYSCVHAAEALKEMGYETIMINCNPETISTDTRSADKLYLSPLTVEDVSEILNIEKPLGVCVQYGGQTPLNLASGLEKAGFSLLGLTFQLISQCEDRKLFREMLETLKLKQPSNFTIHCVEDLPPDIVFPVVIRPSFVLGGRGMRVVSCKEELTPCVEEILAFSSGQPILIEKFLTQAIEVDVDAISDGTDVFIPALMEQIEAAGVHSGDSASVIPPVRLSGKIQEQIKEQTTKIALYLGIKGPLNIQFAIQNDLIFVLEVNPRASRSLPFLSKATGLDLVKMATQCALGKKVLFPSKPKTSFYFVKEAVLPTSKFGHISLGIEMKSTGEVMGMGKSFQEAYAKAQIAAGEPIEMTPLPEIYTLQEVSYA